MFGRRNYHDSFLYLIPVAPRWPDSILIFNLGLGRQRQAHAGLDFAHLRTRRLSYSQAYGEAQCARQGVSRPHELFASCDFPRAKEVRTQRATSQNSKSCSSCNSLPGTRNEEWPRGGNPTGLQQAPPSARVDFSPRSTQEFSIFATSLQLWTC